MSKQRPRLTLEEHLACGKTVIEMHRTLQDLRNLCGSRFGYSKSHYRCISAVIKKFDTFRSEMDNEYHQLIDNETFHKYGHVYYEKQEKEKNTNEEPSDKSVVDVQYGSGSISVG